MTIFRILLLSATLAFPVSALAYSWEEDGERLHFNVQVWKLKAGEAELLFQPSEDNSYTIVGRAWTRGIGSFVKLHDRVTIQGSKVGEQPYVTSQYTAQLNENDYRAHKVVDYVQPSNTAVYQNVHANHEKVEYPIEPFSRDMMSAIYYLRHKVKEIKVGDVHTLPVFDLNTQYELNLRILKKERIKTKFGKRDAYLIKPTLIGLKERNAKDRWSLWVSADESRVPYKISVKMNFGSFDAMLKHYGPPAQGSSRAPKTLPITGDITLQTKKEKSKYDYIND